MPIEYTIIVAFVTLVCTIFGVFIGLGRLRHLQRTDDLQSGHRLAGIEKTLSHIDEGVGRLQSEITEIRVDMRRQFDRIVEAEKDVLVAKMRIDKIEENKKSN